MGFSWPILACGLALALAQQAPVPDPDRQKEAEKLIREIFKDEYAKKAERGALARKLLAQAQESRDDPVTRFVLLREARELAVQAGDLQTSLQAIDATGAAFAVDILPLKSAACIAIGKTAKTPEEIAPLLAAQLKLADEAMERDQYELAKQAADASVALARRLKDLPSLTKAETRAREAGERREKLGRIKKAQETLASSPDDPQANLVVGQFECAIKGDWASGLPKLAKSDDAALKAQAEADLSSPAAAPGQIKVGDGWWDLSEKGDPSQKSCLQQRARHWYLLALSEARGLTRAKLESRLAGIWIPIFDGRSIDCMRPGSQPAWEVIDGVLCKKPDNHEALQTVQLFLDGEFRIRFENRGLTRMTLSVRQGIKGKDALLFEQARIAAMEGKPHEVLFQCRGPEVKAFLDGQLQSLYSRAPAEEGHIQIYGFGPTLKIFSLEYRLLK